jgi:hypothetical protein
MSAIRFPSAATPLLGLCKNHNEGGVFKTHADLLGFLAAYGFSLVHDEGRRMENRPRFAESPGPIQLEIFENRGLLPNILMIALTLGPETYSKDDDLMAKLVEQLADLGAQELALKCAGNVKDLPSFLIAAMSEKEEGKI